MQIPGSAAVVQHEFIPSLRQTSSALLYQDPSPPLFFFLLHNAGVLPDQENKMFFEEELW